MNKLKASIAIIATLLGLLGGVWAMDKHYVPRDYYLLSMDQVQQQISAFQKTNQIQRAQDQAFYWMRIEAQLREELARNPNDQSIQMKLNEVMRQKCDAQKRLNDLQTK